MQFVDLCLIPNQQLVNLCVSGHLIVLIVEFNQIARRLLQFIQIDLLLVATTITCCGTVLMVTGTASSSIQVLVGI